MKARIAMEGVSTHAVRRGGFIAGASVFLFCLLVPVQPFVVDAARDRIAAAGAGAVDALELARSMQIVAGLFLLVIIWWITEPVPLPVTALLPAVVLPSVHVVGLNGGAVVEFSSKNVLANYANPVIYLFLGGFLLAAAMRRWELDRRFTLWILTRGSLADNTRGILLGVMSVTAFLSMWVSNTATAAMMLPIGIGILAMLDLKPGASRYGTDMMLGIAWAASIGGVGTIIGTPPNGIALGILDSALAGTPGYERISFLQWMVIGVPIVLILVPIAWFVLVKRNPPEIAAIPGGRALLLEQRAAMGPMSGAEKRVLGVLLLTVVLWITNPFWPDLLPAAIARRLAWVDEYTIGLFAGVLCFLVPLRLREGRFLLTWEAATTVDWGTLLLFGGGIALADALFKTGLAPWLATSVVSLIGGSSTFVLMLVIVLFMDMLTEVTSNTAITTLVVPIVIAVGRGVGADPVALAVSAALGASLAFMLPVATPPNALVFATGHVPLRTMVRNGFIFDILGWLTVCVVVWFFGGVVLGRFAF